jgi:hypothetical protein
MTPPGSVPPADAHRSSAVLETEETVVSFLRAMLAEGATVTLVADEPLALVAGMLAGEYAESVAADGGEESAHLTIVVVGARRSQNDPLDLIAHAAVSRADTFRNGVGWIDKARAVLFAGAFTRDEIEAVRRTVPAASLFAIAASGIDRRVTRDDIRFLDEMVRREFSLTPRPEEERRAEYEYPPLAFAAQWLVQFLIADFALAVAPSHARTAPLSSGTPLAVVYDQQLIEAMMIDWDEMCARLVAYAQNCIRSARKRWRQFAPPGDFVSRATSDFLNGVIRREPMETTFETLSKRIKQLVHSSATEGT